MLISPNAFVRSTVLLLLVGFLALMAIVGTSFWLVEQNQGWFEQTTQARIARATAVNLRTAVQDAETGQRGFLVTNEDRYLEPYEAAVLTVPGILDNLDTALEPYPESEALIPMVRAAVLDKLDELKQTVDLQRSGDSAGALAIVLSDRGKEAMDRARALFDNIISDADQLIISGVENQRGASTALRWVTIIGAFVIFVVVGGSAWTVLLYTRELASARQEVEASSRV